MKFLDLNGLTNFTNKIKNLIKATADSTLVDSKSYTNDKIDTVNKTYIKELSVSGKTLTYTKGDGSSNDIVIQDISATYNAAGNDLGLVKTGGDVTIVDGIITVKDDSHNHVISNVDGLQAALDGKALSSHTHDDRYYTESEIDAKFDAIIGEGASETLDTIGEISAAIEDNKDMLTTLNSAIGNKANTSDLDAHIGNTTAHITSTERTNWNTAKTHASSTHAPVDAEKNQNAFSNIIVGSTTVSADTSTDTLTFVGSNVTITPDATNDKITFTVADGTTSAKGIVQLTNSTSSTSTTTAATPNSVKSAYDLANTAKTNAATAQTKADNAYDLAASKVGSLSDLNITATATEINYIDGVTSNVQTQLDSKSASDHTHNYAGSSSAGGAATSANKLNSNAGSGTQPIYFENGVPKATTYTLGKSVPSDAKFTDTNTHYESKNVVGSTTATSNTTSALSNGSVYLNSVENGVVTSSHKISGSGATTVTTDVNGNIVISSTDNNTTYNAAGTSLGLVKSGGDVTISSGVITVNDDSHNHTIANVDNLQSSLDSINDSISTHAGNTTSHITSTERTNWNNAKTNAETAIDRLNKFTVNDINNMTALGGTSGQSGYVGFAQLVIGSSYTNRPTEFELICRGKETPCYVSIQFNNGDTKDPDLKTLKYWGSNYGVFVQKIDVGTWLLYYTKSEGYDSVTVVDVKKSSQSITITYPDTFTATKPTENVTDASLGGSIGTASTLSSTLPINKGGTGATTAKAAEYNILNGITEVSDAIGDDTLFTMKYITTNTTNGVLHSRKASLLWNYIKSKADSIYASVSHGNHVPTTETANNAKFLRNDNTWQTVTPANIGAAASSHGTHVSYSTTAPVMNGTASVGSAATVSRSDHVHPTDTSRAAADHTHSIYFDSDTSRSANTVLAAPNGSAGKATFRKLVAADLPSHTHSYAPSYTYGTSAMTPGSSSLATGVLYFQYE